MYGTSLNDETTTNDMFVELALSTWRDVDEELENSSDYLYHQKHYQSYSGRRISMQEILQLDDIVIMMRGIAGIGKTTLVDQMVSEWGHKRLWRGKNGSPDYKFVFLLSAKDLNCLESNKDISSMYDLVRKLFGSAMCNVDEREFKEMCKHSLLVLEGMDELRCLERVCKGVSLTAFEHAVRDIIMRYDGHDVLITGRPVSCQRISKMYSKIKVKKIEVLGYNEDQMKSYVHKFFKQTKTKVSPSDAADRLLELIESVPTLSSMSRVPVFLWILCCAHSAKGHLIDVKTMTELYTLSLLIFLRDHAKIDLSESDDLFSFFDKDVLELLLKICSMAYQMRADGKVVFEYDENFADETLERVGLVISIVVDGIKKLMFRHMTLQEFLCAIHIFVNGIKYSSIQFNPHLQGCFQLIAGLQGAKKGSDPNNIVHRFVKRLTKKFKLETEDDIVSQIGKQLIVANTGDHVFKKEHPTSMLFLACVFEYQYELSENTYEQLHSVAVDDEYFTPLEAAQCLHFIRLITDFGVILKSLTIHEDAKKINQYQHAIQLAENKVFRYMYISSEFINTIINTCGKNSQTKCTGTTFWYCSITEDDLQRLSRHLLYSSCLQFHMMPIPSKFIEDLVNNITPNLTHLTLTGCSLYDRSVILLSKIIPQLKVVGFFENEEITRVGFKAIAMSICETVHSNRTLRLSVLNLGCCSMDDECFKEIAKCLPYIEIMNISGNNLSLASGDILTDELQLRQNEGTLVTKILKLDHHIANHIKGKELSAVRLMTASSFWTHWANNQLCQVCDDLRQNFVVVTSQTHLKQMRSNTIGNYAE